MKYKCPCCEQYTLDEPSGTYAICPICNWEDDPIQLENPEYAGGANNQSLVKARENYKRKDKELMDDAYIDKINREFTRFIDCQVADLQIKYFGDEIRIVVDLDDDETYQLIKFKICQKVTYETDAHEEWRKDDLIKNREYSGLDYYFQDMTVKASKKYKEMYDVSVDFAFFTMNVTCRKISSETIHRVFP